MATKRNNAINSPALGGYTAGGTNRIILTSASTADSVVTDIALTTGQVLIGSTGAAPVASTLTAGAGIGIDSSVPGAITISATGADVYSIVSTSSQTIAAGGSYLITNAGQVTFTLPGAGGFAQGSSFRIIGAATNTGGWKIVSNAGTGTGQALQVGNTVSKTSATASDLLLTSAASAGEGCVFVCSTEASDTAGAWVAQDIIGTPTVTIS